MSDLTQPSAALDKAVCRALGIPGDDFRCPVCDGSHFGSVFADKTLLSQEIVARECHDEFGNGCDWTGSDNECFSTPRVSQDDGEAVKRVLPALRAKGFRVRMDVGSLGSEVTLYRHPRKAQTRHAETLALALCAATLAAEQAGALT